MTFKNKNIKKPEELSIRKLQEGVHPEKNNNHIRDKKIMHGLVGRKKYYFVSYFLEKENTDDALIGNVSIILTRKIKTQQDIRHLESIIVSLYNKEHNDDYTTACILNFRVI